MYAFPKRFMVRMMYALLLRLLAGEVNKLVRLLAHWHAKSKNLTPLARWHAKLKNQYAFGTVARKNENLTRCHVDHAGTYGIRFSKLYTDTLHCENLIICASDITMTVILSYEHGFIEFKYWGESFSTFAMQTYKPKVDIIYIPQKKI